ncbi:unnamed protein product [Candidula unifasciata]|uniref:Chitin-binding type-4 domain-containing protein n=1 Tax=Candidula unifasciata TaxID=100452 RepID=A0A8S3ZQC9_9EUPU|nr:unnamed protein product [Candidula unifasciata]
MSPQDALGDFLPLSWGRSLALITVAVVVSLAEGHGRLLDPPSRATLWEEKFNFPAYYDEYQGFCGGVDAHWGRFGGRCGVCGDPYFPLPRAHERGGHYYTGTPTRTYRSGSFINVTLRITANHRGWIEFRLCAYDDPEVGDLEYDSSGNLVEVTQECLDKHLMSLEDGRTRFYLPGEFANGDQTIKVRLSEGLTCKNCLFPMEMEYGKLGPRR